MSSDVIIKNHEGQDITYPGVSGIVLRTANGSALYLNVNDQPDWAQTDKTAMNYIKNKPFYDNSLTSQCSFETLPEIKFSALGYTFWQIADFALEYSQIFSTVFDITQGSRTYSLTPTESEITLNDEKILAFQSAESGYGFAICYATGAFDVTVNETIVAVDVPAIGIYFIYPQDQIPSTEYFFKITYSDLKTLDKKFLPADLEFSQKQADWDQTDESEKDFIKNKPFGEIAAGTIIVPNQNVNLTMDFTGNGELWASMGSNMGLSSYVVEGKNYNINFDGSYYAGIGVIQDGVGTGVVYQSDGVSILVIDDYEGSGISLVVSNQSGQHTVSITCAEDIVTKINPKYLPDSLPTVTTNDVGKFLRVSADGTWAAESIPSAEGASF